jgi:hypothetical protein
MITAQKHANRVGGKKHNGLHPSGDRANIEGSRWPGLARLHACQRRQVARRQQDWTDCTEEEERAAPAWPNIHAQDGGW